jgi:hypothetical protein
MPEKFFKKIIITFSCFLFLAGFGAKAQDLSVSGPEISQFNQLKIISVGKNAFWYGGINVKGQSSPDTTILLSIKDEKDTFSYSTKTNSDDQGNWSADFNQLLKSNKYYIQALEVDANGNQIGSAIYGPVEIKGAFAFIVYTFSLLVIILLAGFVGGWYINKLAEIKRYRRILVSQRDIIASYTILKNDVDRALKDLRGEKVEDWRINEVKFLLGRVDENLEKMNKYVVRGINIIGKYDIVNKIYDMFKFKKN